MNYFHAIQQRNNEYRLIKIPERLNMRPNARELSQCYQLVTNVMGKINDQGGISIETAGHFKDLLHKLEDFFVTKYMREHDL